MPILESELELLQALYKIKCIEILYQVTAHIYHLQLVFQGCVCAHIYVGMCVRVIVLQELTALRWFDRS